MQTVYKIADMLFASPELAVKSAKLAYSGVAKQVVPNAMLTQVTVVFEDKRKKNEVLEIKAVTIYSTVEHL